MKIEIVYKELIKPSSPTPSQLRDFKLSFIDVIIPHFYQPLIIYFSNFNEKENTKQQEIVGRLKRSLSDALVEFYPLAGRMKGQIFVDCNDNGILYVEARGDGKMLDIIKSSESEILDKLTPFITSGFVSTLEELLAVQITSFSCGGIAIGMCISHRIADHHSLSTFTKCWAAIARRDHPNLISPLFNSAALFPPRNTPDSKPNLKSPSVQPLAPNVVMRSFLFTPSAITALKTEITNTTLIANPSRVEAVTAFLWAHCAAAYGLKESDTSIACHPVNIRGKIPALTEYSFGNLFQMMFAESCGETSWIRLVEKLRSGFGALDKEYMEKLLGERGFELAKENFLEISKHLGRGNVEVFRFSSFCRFSVFEADFGWGKPVWLSYAGVPNKNCIFLFDCLDMAGGVEAWIMMTDQAMERLRRDEDFMRFTTLRM